VRPPFGQQLPAKGPPRRGIWSRGPTAPAPRSRFTSGKGGHATATAPRQPTPDPPPPQAQAERSPPLVEGRGDV